MNTITIPTNNLFPVLLKYIQDSSISKESTHFSETNSFALTKGHTLCAVHNAFKETMNSLRESPNPTSQRQFAKTLLKGLQEGSLIYKVEINDHQFLFYGTKKAKAHLTSSISQTEKLPTSDELQELTDSELDSLEQRLESTLHQNEEIQSAQESESFARGIDPQQEELRTTHPRKVRETSSSSRDIESLHDSLKSKAAKAVADAMYAEDSKRKEQKQEQEKKKEIERQEIERQEKRLETIKRK